MKNILMVKRWEKNLKENTWCFEKARENNCKIDVTVVTNFLNNFSANSNLFPLMLLQTVALLLITKASELD